MRVVLPDWCELVRGDGPVLLVAPHGGRRPRVDPTAPPANLKVNDVYTAELTRELAARLRVTAVINHGCDRNALDLNRVSQVRRRAPWFLELLRDEIAAILARHEQAEILFVHGWNVGQVKCDFGIGASEGAEGIRSSHSARLTVTPAYLEGRVGKLRAALEARAVSTFIGIRYPASHPNNVLQMFTDRSLDEHCAAAEREISAWATGGRLQALQLELGVPLRWPGVWRERLVECLVAEFAEKRASLLPYDTQGAASSRQAEEIASSRRATSLQFYDPASNIGLLAGVGPIGKETVAARLLLFLGGQRVALFTGESTPPRALVVEPLEIRIDGDTTMLRFRGPILDLDDGATYLDLEAAFAASTLVDIDVDIRFVRCGIDPSGAEFGRVEGCVEIGGERREIRAAGFANAGIARMGQRGGYAMLAADFGEGHAILANITGAAAPRVVEFRGNDSCEIQATAAKLPDAVTSPFELMFADAAILQATPVSRMEILRSLAGGGYARVTFGTARFDWGGRRGYGLYEYAALV